VKSKLFYLWLLPLLWGIFTAISFFCSGDEHALFAYGSLAGTWICFLYEFNTLEQALIPVDRDYQLSLAALEQALAVPGGHDHPALGIQRDFVCAAKHSSGTGFAPISSHFFPLRATIGRRVPGVNAFSKKKILAAQRLRADL